MSTVLDVVELIFAVLLKYVSLNDGPYTLLQNGSFFYIYLYKHQKWARVVGICVTHFRVLTCHRQP